jgi:hypothetical protein
MYYLSIDSRVKDGQWTTTEWARVDLLDPRIYLQCRKFDLWKQCRPEMPHVMGTVSWEVEVRAVVIASGI